MSELSGVTYGGVSFRWSTASVCCQAWNKRQI